MQSVPRDIAVRLCDELQREHRQHPLSLSAMRCLGCILYSGVEPDIRLGETLEVCEAIRRRYAEGRGEKAVSS